MRTSWASSLAAVEAGDVVRLRSGGERMTVAEQNGPMAVVAYWRNGVLMTERIGVAALEVVDHE